MFRATIESAKAKFGDVLQNENELRRYLCGRVDEARSTVGTYQTKTKSVLGQQVPVTVTIEKLGS